MTNYDQLGVIRKCQKCSLSTNVKRRPLCAWLLRAESNGSILNVSECRPCSRKETLEMFCSSDFVARGSISSIFNDAQLDQTLMTVRASRVIRQASSVFRPTSRKRKRKWIAAPSKWKGMDGVEEDLSDADQDHVATLHLPLSCHVKHGSGEFLFMGRKRLGDAVLWCAPRLEEWEQWIAEANTQGTAQCRLESWIRFRFRIVCLSSALSLIFVRSLARSFVCLFVCLFVRSFVHFSSRMCECMSDRKPDAVNSTSANRNYGEPSKCKCRCCWPFICLITCEFLVQMETDSIEIESNF